MGSRSLSGKQGGFNGDLEEEGIAGKPLLDKPLDKWQSQALLSGVAYCISSCSMILLNKLVLSVYNWEAGISLMLYQNLVSVVIVYILKAIGAIRTEPITWKLVGIWFPVNVIFISMLISSIYSLKYMNVAMVTVLKNATNLLTAVGEIYLFKKRHSIQVWGSLFLMNETCFGVLRFAETMNAVSSAVCGGVTDLSFHRTGYCWQSVNCFLTAAYSLTLRKVMDIAKQATKSGSLNELSMVLLNNSLSLPLALVLIFIFNEVEYLYSSPIVKLPMFWVVSTLSGFLGTAISFTSMWFLRQTGPTTYSLVGSLNKIPLSIAGMMLFKVTTSASNLLSIFLGLLAGVLFARAKMS